MLPVRLHVTKCSLPLSGGPRSARGRERHVGQADETIKHSATRRRGSKELTNGVLRSMWGVENLEINPMNQSLETRLANLVSAPRCGAKTRAGTPCQCPAIRGRKRCRLHGGLSPGAPKGIGNGNYKNGTWTAEAIEERSWLRSLASAFAKKDGGP
jgi:hypothetical protein